MAVEGGIPYLYCQWGADDAKKWRVKIDAEFPKREEKYICTTDQGYADAYKYGQKLSRWIEKNCK